MHRRACERCRKWVPAFAGMTKVRAVQVLNLPPRPFDQPALAVAGVAEGEVEYFAEHPGLAFQIPFRPRVARHRHAAAAFARIFYPRSSAFCHARMVAWFGSASERSVSETEKSAPMIAVAPMPR